MTLGSDIIRVLTGTLIRVFANTLVWQVVLMIGLAHPIIRVLVSTLVWQVALMLGLASPIIGPDEAPRPDAG